MIATYIHTHIHTYIHTYIHTHIYTYLVMIIVDYGYVIAARFGRHIFAANNSLYYQRCMYAFMWPKSFPNLVHFTYQQRANRIFLLRGVVVEIWTININDTHQACIPSRSGASSSATLAYGYGMACTSEMDALSHLLFSQIHSFSSSLYLIINVCMHEHM